MSLEIVPKLPIFFIKICFVKSQYCNINAEVEAIKNAKMTSKKMTLS